MIEMGMVFGIGETFEDADGDQEWDGPELTKGFIEETALTGLNRNV